MDDLSHQFENTAGPLESFNRRPVQVEPVKKLRVDRIRLTEAVVIVSLLRFARQHGPFGHVGVSKGAADSSATLFVLDRFEQAAADDFKSFVGGNRLPESLHAAEPLFESRKGLRSTGATGL